MDDDFIVTTFAVLDKTLAALGHRDDVRTRASDAAVLTVAVVAAKYFQGHLARALQVLHLGHSLAGALSVSRFNRRLHALRGWLPLLLEALGEVFAHGEVFLIDSMPVPVCKRARARRCRKVSGKAFCGVCPAKQKQSFGCRLHLSGTPAGAPLRFDLVPGGLHDLTPIHELTDGWPEGATMYDDKGENAGPDEAPILADTGVRLVPLRTANMAPNLWADKLALRAYRKRIETRYSQREALGLGRLRAHQPRPGTQGPRRPPRCDHRQCRLAITV